MVFFQTSSDFKLQLKPIVLLARRFPIFRRSTGSSSGRFLWFELWVVPDFNTLTSRPLLRFGTRQQPPCPSYKAPVWLFSLSPLGRKANIRLVLFPDQKDFQNLGFSNRFPNLWLCPIRRRILWNFLKQSFPPFL